MSTPWDRAAGRLHQSLLRFDGRDVSWQSQPPLGELVTVRLVRGTPINPEDGDTYVVREGLKSAFTPPIAHGDLMTENGTTYTVYDVTENPPESGWLKIRMRK